MLSLLHISCHDKLFFALLLFHFLIFLNKSCDYSFSEYGVTYDLSPLLLSASQKTQLKYYTVWDSRNDSSSNYTYEFNICDAVLEYPNEPSCLLFNVSGGAKGYCPDISSTNSSCASLTTYTNKVYAYQIKMSPADNGCYRLSKEDGGPPTWQLINNDDPSEGVVLIYDGGDYCAVNQINRKFHIRFECENNYFNVPDLEQVIEDSCTYNLTLKSIYGCPTQCGVYGNSLCNNQGTCGYDWSNYNAKCFCYYGYQGDSCSELQSTSQLSKIPTSKPINSQSNPNYYHTFNYIQTSKNSINNNNINVNMNITYDLSSFHLNPYYIVYDQNNRTYKYYWAFLDNIPSNNIPNICANATSACNTIDNPNCTNLSTIGSSKIGSVFQVTLDETQCFLLGSTNDIEWNLFDVDNVVKGVSITYNNGGYCRSHNSNRQFTIQFECPDSTRNSYNINQEKNISAYVYEDDSHQCEYTLHIISSLACPYQCITEMNANYNNDGSMNEIDNANINSSFSICNQHGVCGSDPNVGFTHCLCDDNWTDDYCQTKYIASTSTSSNDNHTGFQIAIGIIVFLLIILIIVVLYLYMRNRSLKQFQDSILDAETDAVVKPPYRDRNNHNPHDHNKQAPVRVPDRDYSDSEENDEESPQRGKHKITEQDDDEDDLDEHDHDHNSLDVHNIELTDKNTITHGNNV